MRQTAEGWKAAVRATLDRLGDDLVATSRAIHADPETAFQEHRAAARLTDLLVAAGFRIARGVGNLPTAFRAEIGDGDGPTIGVCAEYDALPELGHGCGHNIIATAGVGAALAMAYSGVAIPGRLVVVGTPAEEGGGGKVLLLDSGVFNDLDAAMMIHPGGRNIVDRGSLASTRVTITFTGVATHADAPPGSGVNALDAVIQTFALVNGLRAGLRPDARIHGVIVEGGVTPTVIPARALARFSVRAADKAYAQELLAKVVRCAEAAALATGATVAIDIARPYENMVPSAPLADAFAANLVSLGVAPVRATGNERMGSTDMGNVSQVVPSIHPYLAIADVGVAGHSVGFREASCSPAGDAAVRNGALALALTAIDCFADPTLVPSLRAAFEEQRRAGRVVGRRIA